MWSVIQQDLVTLFEEGETAEASTHREKAA